jgi:hypothetical protein
MLRFDLPQQDSRYSVWIQLCTPDELSNEIRHQVPSLRVEMMQSDNIVVYSPYNGALTSTIPYSELLSAFPDINPEATHLLMHFEYYSERFMYKYIVNTQVEAILDTVMTVTDWIELYPLEEQDVETSELRECSLHATPETMIPVRHTLTNELVYVPFARLMEEFPDLDSARTTVITSYGVEFDGLITQEELDAECAKRGWRSVRVPEVFDEELDTPEQRLLARYPDLKKDDTPSPFQYVDQGYRLTLHSSHKR